MGTEEIDRLWVLGVGGQGWFDGVGQLLGMGMEEIDRLWVSLSDPKEYYNSDSTNRHLLVLLLNNSSSFRARFLGELLIHGVS
jgi:hypothetical protein